MKSLLKSSILLFAALAFGLTSCHDDDGDHGHEHEGELITTLRMTMVPVGGGATVTATFKDQDGPGGQAPTQDQITLKHGVTYNTTIAVLDESKTPAEDLTSEIMGKGHEHQFFFVPSSGLGVTVAYDDADRDNRPIGIRTRITANAMSSGTLRVVLKHQPGTKSATSTINTGATDIEVNFATQVTH